MNIGPVMLDLEGTTLNDQEREILQHPLLGGIIYFGRNYQSPEQLQALTDDIRSLRPDVLIAVDQEGGRVQRFKKGFTPIPAMQQFLPLYRKNPQACLSLAKDVAWLLASELLVVGIDFSFAPVLDLDDHRCPAIGNRSFSPEPRVTVDIANSWLAGMHEAGMATTGKHFPGHGGVTLDSHHDIPVDGRSFTELENRDLIPFIQLQPQLDAMMPAHIIFPQIDEQQTVGFSSIWLQAILRHQLGFKGVIFSDDLSMAGAACAGRYIDRAKRALAAGCDMVLVCNNRQGALAILEQLNSSDRTDSNRRLLTMQGKPPHQPDELKSLPRWQLTRQLLHTLTID